MNPDRSRRRLLGAGALLATGAAVSRPEVLAAAPLGVGFVYVSPVTDAGWTHQHDQGRAAVEREFGARVQVTTAERVGEGAQAERVIRDMALQGAGLIFTTSFGFMEPTLRVAREFPQTRFEHCSGYKTAANVGNYNARFHEGRYLAGLLAGSASATGRLGMVAAFPIPEVIQGINAFVLGARSVNPEATLQVIWTQAWFDPGREREAAAALIDQGVDLLTHHTDSSAVPRAAEARETAVIGYHSDMSHAAPVRLLASVTHHWGDYYIARTRAALEGRWKPAVVRGGLAEGMVGLTRGPAFPANQGARIDAAQAAITEGRLDPFGGPILDNEGRLRVAAGSALAAQDLDRMDWYVQGVQGRVPR